MTEVVRVAWIYLWSEWGFWMTFGAFALWRARGRWLHAAGVMAAPTLVCGWGIASDAPLVGFSLAAGGMLGLVAAGLTLAAALSDQPAPPVPDSPLRVPTPAGKPPNWPA